MMRVFKPKYQIVVIGNLVYNYARLHKSRYKIIEDVDIKVKTVALTHYAKMHHTIRLTPKIDCTITGVVVVERNNDYPIAFYYEPYPRKIHQGRNYEYILTHH